MMRENEGVLEVQDDPEQCTVSLNHASTIHNSILS